MKITRRHRAEKPAPLATTNSSQAAATTAPAKANDDDHKARKIAVAVLGLGATAISLVGCGTGPGTHPQLQAREKGPSASAEPFATSTTQALPANPKDAVVTIPARPSPTDIPTHAAPPAAPAVVERGPLQVNLAGVFQVTKHEQRVLAPGVHHHKLTGNMGGRQVAHVVEIDLNRPEYDITSNHSNQRNKTVSQWAAQAKPVVAINADFFDMSTHQPRGLAIADGEVWPGSRDLPDHTVMGCTAMDVCTFDREGEVKQADPAWTDAVGMNGARLVVDGAIRQHTGAFYTSDRHPRAAVGLTDDNRLILVAIEGRLGDAAGATWNETANFLSRFGTIKQGGMLDGGGSLTLVHTNAAGGVERLSRVPGNGAERPVANMLAIRNVAVG